MPVEKQLLSRRRPAVGVICNGFARVFPLVGCLFFTAGPSVQLMAQPLTPLTFDLDAFTQTIGPKVDLSRFEKSTPLAPGTYRVDVYINGYSTGRWDIDFVDKVNSSELVPCFNQVLLTKLGIALEKIPPRNSQAPNALECAEIGSWLLAADVLFDPGSLALTLSIPQLYMKPSARAYVDPSQWDSGITAGLLNYNFSTSLTTEGERNDRTYLGLNGGVNLGQWRLRHQGAQAWSNRGRSPYQSTATYVQRSVAPLQSLLTIGDSFTGGQILDNVGLRGISLATDERMLAQSQRGYAPVVRGIADSNATVSISQNGYRIYETTVAPGPFVIDDLFATGYGGDLTVSVTEVGGRKRSFVVPFSVTPQLLRADAMKYSAALGQVRQNSSSRSSPAVVQGTLSRGLSNAVTLYGGSLVSEGYAQAKLGTAFNTSLGAFSLEAGGARTAIPGQGTSTGTNFGIAYNKNLVDSGTNVVLGAYRFTSEGYLSLIDAINIREWARKGTDPSSYARQKSRVDLTLSQKLGSGTLSLYGSSADYWGRSQGRQTSFTLGYGASWQKVNWNLSWQRSRIDDGRQLSSQESSDDVFFGRQSNAGRADNRFVLSLSLPLGGSSRAPSLNSSLSRNSGSTDSSHYQVGLSGLAGEQNELSYDLSGSRNADDGATHDSLNAYGGYRTSAANLRAGYGRSGHNSQLSFSADGGLVAHREGVTLSQSLGEAVALVHVPDAQGALLSSAGNVRVDGRGYAVAPSLLPFQQNRVSLDPSGTSFDVELSETSRTVAPTLGAVSLLEFATVSGRAVVLKSQQEGGRNLPFAAQVFDEQGVEVGVVGQGSKAFVRGIAEKGTLTVRWGEGQSEQCHIAYQLPVQDKRQRQVSADWLQGQCLARAAP